MFRINERLYKLIFFVLLCQLSASVSSEIYKWTDSEGRVHFGDVENERYNAEKIDVKVNSYEHVTYSSLGWKPPERSSGRSREVEMFSTSWCGYCKKARRYFQSSGIAFVEYDIESDARAKDRYDALGGKGVPLIRVGTKLMNGFSVAGFKKIYP